MSATFNWAYRPGVTNKYGLTIAASADNVRPSNACYVALFGNDNTGNGSRQLPYKTLAKAISLQVGTIIIGSGIYREGDFPTSQGISIIIGDGDVIIDLTLRSIFFSSNRGGDVSYYNLYVRGAGAMFIFGPTGVCKMLDCTFDNVFANSPWGSGGNWTNVSNCVFINSVLSIGGVNSPSAFVNNTFYKSNVWFTSPQTPVYGFALAMIFHSCNVHFSALPSAIDFNLYYNCNFRLITSVPTVPTTFYPSVPTGFNYYPTLSDFLTACATAFGSSSIFAKSIFSDPLFNNRSIGDYSLGFNSPAKNLSYFGTYGGAKSIGYSIKARAIESAGGFEFSSAVNLTIADDSITFTDITQDAQIDTKVIVNTQAREISNFSAYGFNADRNGQYIDSIADLATSVKNAGDALGMPAPYLVEVGAIVYNGATYQPGDKFTTVTGATTFTTTASGILREILEAPQRHTIMARFSDGGSIIGAGSALTVSYYYYVVSGSIIYDSITYNASDVFKAVDVNAFSGSGIVIVAFSTEAFQHYEPGLRPTSNNTGDIRTGSIIRGNGDPAYVRGGIGVQEFPINAKFIQIRYFIRANNLKP